MSWPEWVFSGIGVLALTLIGNVLKRYFKRGQNKASPQVRLIATAEGGAVASAVTASGTGNIQHVNIHHHNEQTTTVLPNSVPPPKYNESPTPDDVQQQIWDAPPFQRQIVRESFVDLRVRWRLSLLSLEPEMVIYMTTAERDNDCRPKLHSVLAIYKGREGPLRSVGFTVNLSEYPELKTLSNDEEFWVSGTIQTCKHSISLKDVTDITPVPRVSEQEHPASSTTSAED
jgi:hypothetical protein